MHISPLGHVLYAAMAIVGELVENTKNAPCFGHSIVCKKHFIKISIAKAQFFVRVATFPQYAKRRMRPTPKASWQAIGGLEITIQVARAVGPDAAVTTGSSAEPAVAEPSLGATRVALNMLSAAVFVLRSNSEIVESNEAGQQLLRVSRAFRRHQNRLVIRRAADAAAMAEAVSRVAAKGEPEMIRFLTRQEEASALMRIEPVPGEPVVLVCITELRAPLLLDANWSRAAFGFSPQNAALAESLALGHSLAEFATAENLPIGTVRTRLKKLLAQTGLGSQASLAAMLLRASSIMSGGETLRGLPNGRK
jgi:DNA-binding CsgD family transcriptional regulator